MPRSAFFPTTEEKLGFAYVLNQLQKDGIMSSQQVAQLNNVIPKPDESVNPLILIAEQGLRSNTEPVYPLTLERLTQWLAEKTGAPYLRIDPLKIDVNNVTKIVSQAYATNLNILPVEVTAKDLIVATCEPFITGWEHELSRIAKLNIKRVIANPKDIERYLVEFYGISRSIFGAVKSKANETISRIQNFEQLVEVGKMGEPDANDRHIVSIVDWLLQYAFEQRASDIHLEPRRDKGRVRFRIDGNLQQVHEFPSIIMGAIASRLKTLGRMDVTDKRRPQDGRIKTKTPAGNEVEMRLSTMPTAFGEKLVIRIFNPEMLFKNFSQLGFSNHDQKCWADMTGHPHGIILVTGPTGSGKTTTLYSALKYLSRPEFNICTIEDPIEMVDAEFNQMQVLSNIGVSFAAGVRTLLRQDPDIIMVGEIRDYETAEIAIQAALTGHLVLSSLHTNDAPSSITRLIDIGAQPFLISATLLGVLAQRLVRTLCLHCKKPVKLEQEAWSKLTSPIKLKLPEKTFTPVGCDECRHTGYYGRIGIYEALPIGKSLRHLISTNANLEAIRSAALKQGMRQLRISGAQKVAEGQTTLEEIYLNIPADDSDI
jgi:general secretion pathway protein E